MILDYAFNRKERKLSVSYIKDNGSKSIINFNVDKFETYYPNNKGRYLNWDGTRCDVKYTENPSKFDIKNFLFKMQPQYQKLLSGKVAPKLYTFDIEVEISDEFPEPSEAKYPITTISVADENCNVIVLGIKKLEDGGDKYIVDNFQKYMSNSKYFKSLNLPLPKIQYIYFESEREMLRFFLKDIVSKVSVLAGWNSLLFDWQYIQTRIRTRYEDLSINMSSINYSTHIKTCQDMRQDDIRLTLPDHTLVLDMMDVVGTFDQVVMPIKESLSLDYIASESIGMNKIKYDGSLQTLFEKEYPKYVFYNAIDSVLVQLINKKFQTLQNIYTQALYCKEKIGSCFSKIALTEALIFNNFYEQGIKVIYYRRDNVERGNLVGAYVKEPFPGKHNYVCCNDFASLYPSGIITCNLSFENYMGHDYTKEELEEFKKDPKYFVSINGNVYKNDKVYSFKHIQSTLKANRNTGKYLAKQLDAEVMSDIDHILKDLNEFSKKPIKKYAENLKKAMLEIGFTINNSSDLLSMSKDELLGFKTKLRNEITYYTSFEQAMKLLGNSMYGGMSHVACFWYNMDLANDITGEGRNLIHMMEKHIPEYWKNNWMNLTDVHKMLGVKINKKQAEDVLKEYGSFVEMVYGDTDSLYISYEPMLKSLEGYDKMSIPDKRDIIVKLNTQFMDNHNEGFMQKYYESRHVISVHKFELETLSLSGVWLDVKKRYAQILLWKDGKYFDLDSLPLKIKGLEMIKSSVPKQAREGLKRVVRYFLEDINPDFFIQRLNIKMQEEKQLFFKAPLEDICGSLSVNNYTKYIIDDSGKNGKGLLFEKGTPSNVKALGNYNWIRNKYNLSGDPIYGGKLRWYIYRDPQNNAKDWEPRFAFLAKNYPDWANHYAPVNRSAMFQLFMLDPFNRILEANNIPILHEDGFITLSLF